MVERKKIAGRGGETGAEAWAPVPPGSLFIAALFFFLSIIREPGTGYHKVRS